MTEHGITNEVENITDFCDSTLMDFSTITLADLKRLAPLIGERDAVAARLAEINAALGSLSGSIAGAPHSASSSASKPAIKASHKVKAPAAAKDKPATGKGPGRHGGLKDAILTILRQAPTSGVSVETIAQSLGRKAPAIHTWFFTTGKGIKEIKKTGRGIYSWEASQS